MRRLVIVSMLVLVTGTLLTVFWWPSGRPLTRGEADQLREVAVANMDKGFIELAYPDFERILTDFPDDHTARIKKAMISLQRQRIAEASDALAKIPDEYLASHFDDARMFAKSMMDSGFLFDAEPFLKRLLVIKPNHAPSRRELLRCYRLSGENAAAAELLVSALRESKVELSDLLMATAPLTNWANPDDVQFMKGAGQRSFDSLTMLGYARRQMQSGQQSRAEGALRQIVAQRPDWQPALAQLAIVNWQLGREDEWRRVMSHWDPAAIDHPNAWFIWGVWHALQDDSSTAVRCFGEALQRDPKHSGAASQLIVPLRKLGREAEANAWTAYVEQLAQLDLACLSVGLFTHTSDDVKSIALGCQSLGWDQEAHAWYRYALQRWPGIDWPDFTTTAPTPKGTTDTPALPQRRMIAELDFQQFPLPKKLSQPEPTSVANASPSTNPPSWRLDNEAAQMGIAFRFKTGDESNHKQGYMYEFSGPGVGVLDYDVDGWPDLELTQGAPWPAQPNAPPIRDELFRNQGDGTFVPVAALSGLDDSSYSQGPAVGDLNCDGFPDVYVCNIGPNRCYLNNGDGTFTDITAGTRTAGDDWSLSAAWADFNADGLPDLYVVNYLAGNALERACVGTDGRRLQCSPTFFPAADDRLYLNAGDGTFQDISHDAGILIPDGKGMGIAVGRLMDNRRIGIFVANDMTPNFLFVPQHDPSSSPRYENVGAVTGVAFGPQGTAQSSMGVAVGDVNGDGRVDMFVTNFLSETTNLFMQGPEGVYEDAANRFGLLAGGLRTEGWGAQFLDMDADGHLDLFVANGHLEEFSAADRMPAQLFRNLNGEKFDLVSGPSIGRYFGRNYLGRSVALWDWNRDGREDLAVTHVSDSAAILTNRTEKMGHRLGLRLVGVRAARDPAGAQLKLTTGGRTLVRELASGDGYAASNERRLYFGLGASADSVEVEVDWSGDVIQRFSGLDADGEYILIEGRPDAVLLHRYDGVMPSTVR